MSGGSLCYFFGDLLEHVGDFGDAELDGLVKDLANLFHDREWFLSGDTCEGEWNEARDSFKRKWFTEIGRQERIEEYLEKLRDDVMRSFGFGKHCGSCASWTPGSVSKYGRCALHPSCLMHRGENSCKNYLEKEVSD